MRALPSCNELDEAGRRALEFPARRNRPDEELPPARLDDRAQPAAFIGHGMIDEYELAA